MNYKEKVIEELKKVPQELQSNIVEQREVELDKAFNQGYQICMLKTLDLLIDSKLKDDTIIELLQKHFNLRLSEAEDMIRTAKNRRSRKLNEKK